MPEETPFQPPVVDPLAIIKGALAKHSDRLIPGAVAELSVMWVNQLDRLDPSILDEVVAMRLDQERYAGFKKSKPVPAVPASDDPIAIRRDQNKAFADAFLEGKRAAQSGERIVNPPSPLGVAAPAPSKGAGDANKAFADAFVKARADAKNERY